MNATAETPAHVGSDSEGCLLVAASYSDIAPAVRSAVAEAATRIMRSAVLGDFIEIRFVDLGSRPRRKGAVRVAVIPRIVRELLDPPAVFDRNYFAFAIIDKSASQAERILSQLTASPAVQELPIRQRGLTGADDRKPARVRQDAGVPVPDDLVQALRSLSAGSLASALRSFAQEVMLNFADGHEHGLTHAQVSLLSPVEGEGSRARENQGPEAPANQRRGTAQRTACERAAAPGGPHGRSAGEAEAPPVQGEATARPDKLLLLLLSEDPWLGKRDASRRRQAAMLELDRKISELPRLSCQVHALTAGQDATESRPRQAGQLSRRDLRPSPDSLDFARSLEIARSAIKKDLASLAPASRPVVVFFAAEPPFADPVSAAIYSELAAEATVAWVLPEQSADLLSPAFAAHGARIITGLETAADEIIRLLQEQAPEGGPVRRPGCRR